MTYQFGDAFEAAVKDHDEAKAVEHLNASIQMAKKCLTHGDFHKYREEFEKAYDFILTDMVGFTNRYLAEERGSLEMYAVKMIRYMQRIQDLRVLLNRVNVDSNKSLITENKDNG